MVTLSLGSRAKCMWTYALDYVRLVFERLRRKYKYASNVCLEHFAFFHFSVVFMCKNRDLAC